MPKAINGWKACSKCREKKPVSKFSKTKQQGDGLDCWCKACRRRYHEANRKKFLAQQKAYRNSEAGKVTRKREGAKYRASKKGRAANARYDQSEKGQATHLRASTKRRALKAGASSDMSPEDLVLLSMRHPVCNYCGHEFSANGGRYKRTLDHIVPYSQGGQNVLSNLVYACARCNGSKGTKLPEEWVDRWYERVKGGHRHDRQSGGS